MFSEKKPDFSGFFFCLFFTYECVVVNDCISKFVVPYFLTKRLHVSIWLKAPVWMSRVYFWVFSYKETRSHGFLHFARKRKYVHYYFSLYLYMETSQSINLLHHMMALCSYWFWYKKNKPYPAQMRRIWLKTKGFRGFHQPSESFFSLFNYYLPCN